MWQTLQTALTPYILSPLTVLLCLSAAGGWGLGSVPVWSHGWALLCHANKLTPYHCTVSFAVKDPKPMFS